MIDAVGETGRFCPDCGSRLQVAVETAGGRPHCPECGFVRYRNPIVGVAVVVRDAAGGVLMGQRARGPYAGLWCIPCGYVEWDEEIRQAGPREFLEETGLLVETGGIVAVHSNFHNARQHTVGVWFEGRVIGGELYPADGEFTALAFHDPADPPPLAFPTDGLVLADLALGSVPAALDLLDETTTPRTDVSPLFANADALRAAAASLAMAFRDDRVDSVAAIDALGLVLGTAVARELGVGVTVVRKGGKLPTSVLSETFVDYSGEAKTLEMRHDAIAPGARLLIVDEWIETGAQVSAAARLIERAGGVVAGVAALNIDANEATEALRPRYRCVGLRE